jgi:hypothetical protein
MTMTTVTFIKVSRQVRPCHHYSVTKIRAASWLYYVIMGNARIRKLLVPNVIISEENNTANCCRVLRRKNRPLSIDSSASSNATAERQREREGERI